MKVMVQRRLMDGNHEYLVGRQRAKDGNWSLIFSSRKAETRWWRTLAACSWFLHQVGADLTGVEILCLEGIAPEQPKAKAEKKAATATAAVAATAACQEISPEEPPCKTGEEQAKALAAQVEIRKGGGTKAKVEVGKTDAAEFYGSK